MVIEADEEAVLDVMAIIVNGELRSGGMSGNGREYRSGAGALGHGVMRRKVGKCSSGYEIGDRGVCVWMFVGDLGGDEFLFGERLGWQLGSPGCDVGLRDGEFCTTFIYRVYRGIGRCRMRWEVGMTGW
jgi:hypothetical protein